jgi:hypothetical protein
MVEGQPQRTAGAVPAPSVVVGVDATLLAACQLLNNPPSSVTSTFGAPDRGTWCFSGSKASTTPSRRPRDDVAASQPEARGGCAPMRVHSHRRVRAPAVAQPQQNEQALSVERLCKFYPSGDMSGSVPVYVIQGFHTVN